ncbi:MAG: dehydrogenase, partial [Proteobacteria bacterium]|nr:dehydrogenase [Pseudomonadota bacterium]
LYGPFDHTRDTHGNQASFRRGFDGWLYATHGFNNDSHVTARDGSHVDLNSGNTYRIRLDGSRIEHHTHGQVNPFGLAWDARGNLYSSDCHSAPLYQLLAGGWYPSFGKPHDGLGFAPVMLEHAHGSTAIDGAVYYNDDLWPAEYRDTLFIGNVMTSRLNRDTITFNGSTPKATEQPDFLTTTDPWFRPVDATLGPDGALYIADFYNRIIGHYEVPLTHPGRDRERGRLWRVVYKGTDGRARLRSPALPKDLDGLVGELGSPSLSRRLLAMGEIQDRFGAKALPAVGRAASKARSQKSGSSQERADQGSAMRISALWLQHRLGGLDAGLRGREFLADLSDSRDSLVRIHAL